MGSHSPEFAFSLVSRVMDWIGGVGLQEGSQAQDTTIADSAGLLLAGIAGPGEMKWGIQFHAEPDDFAFF